MNKLNKKFLYKLIIFIISLIPIKIIRRKLRENFEYQYYSNLIKKEIKNNASTETIFVIGDSHTDIFNGHKLENKHLIIPNITYEESLYANISNSPKFITYLLGACLAYTTNSKKSTFSTFKKVQYLIDNNFLPKNCIICCSFGEIDCRVHIQKQAEKQNKSIEEIIDNVIKNYGDFLLNLKNQGYKIIAYAPIATQKDTVKLDKKFPRYATEIERNYIVSIFNEKLKNFCNMQDLMYLSIFNNLVNEDGSSKGEYYLTDGVHLKPECISFIETQIKTKGNEIYVL